MINGSLTPTDLRTENQDVKQGYSCRVKIAARCSDRRLSGSNPIGPDLNLLFLLCSCIALCMQVGRGLHGKSSRSARQLLRLMQPQVRRYLPYSPLKNCHKLNISGNLSES